MSRTVLVPALLIGLLAGCGAEGGKRTPTAVTAATAAPSPSAKVLTRTQLEPGLLTLADLPTGYARSAGQSDDPEDVGAPSASSAECERLFAEFGGEDAGDLRAETAAVEYEKTELGPVVEQELTSFPDAAELTGELTKIRDAITRCGQFTETDEDGALTVRMSPAPLPPLGDDTAAFKLDATGAVEGTEIAMSGYLVAVRVGNTLCTVVHFGLPSVDAAETEQIARKAVDKLLPLAR